jgi:bifunctional non-homologous end joining protein LigD
VDTGQTDLDPKRFTVRAVPGRLSRSKAWHDYSDSHRPLELAVKRLGKVKQIA